MSMLAAAPRPRLRVRVAPWAWAVLVLLLLQNVLGIYLNLFVPLPQGPDLVSLMAAYAILAGHVIVGILLLVSTGVTVLLAARTDRRTVWGPALAALAFTFLAFESGIEFVIGGQNDGLSFLMELAFLGAVASDVLVLSEAGRGSSAAGTEVIGLAAKEGSDGP